MFRLRLLRFLDLQHARFTVRHVGGGIATRLGHRFRRRSLWRSLGHHIARLAIEILLQRRERRGFLRPCRAAKQEKTNEVKTFHTGSYKVCSAKRQGIFASQYVVVSLKNNM